MATKKSTNTSAPIVATKPASKKSTKKTVEQKDPVIINGQTKSTVSSIKKSNPARRKSFRARHKCSTAKPGTARYLSCKNWW